jgi:hypothetical protein
MSFLETKPFIFINYHVGCNGNLLFRVLCAHPEIYWHDDWANHPDVDKSPLGWPDVVDCYNIEWAQSFIGNTKTNFYAVHAQWHEDHNADSRYLKQYLKDFAQSKAKWYPMKNHRFTLRNGTYSREQDSNLDKCHHVLVKKNPYLARDRLEVIHRDRDRDFIKGCKQHYGRYRDKAHLIVDIDRLISPNYNIFLSEYLNIIHYFDLTPMINPVRAYILLYNERQTR